MDRFSLGTKGRLLAALVVLATAVAVVATSASATVNNGDSDLTALNFSTHTRLPVTVEVGTFTDTDGSDASDFAATIDWGDGSPLSNATVQNYNGDTGELWGTHTYASPGPYTVTVTLSEPNDETAISESSTATVTAVYAGTPGNANCIGKTNSALSNAYNGDLSAAAQALGFNSVQALQKDVKQYCSGN